MATFLINTAGVFQEGTPADDFFIVQSGAFGDTLYGAEGNDDFDFTLFTNGYTYGNGIAGGNEGNDTIEVQVTGSMSLLGNYFGGGQGDDLLKFQFQSAGDIVGNTMHGGEGNDTIFWSADSSANTFRNNTINGNAGNDLIELTGIAATGGGNNVFQGMFIGGGQGVDEVNVSFSAQSANVFDGVSVNGGLDTDVISFQYVRTAENLNINGGTFGTIDSLDASDNIFVSAANLLNVTVAGNNGNDRILVQANNNTSTNVLVAGNVGDDTLSLSGTDFGNTTIGGGVGNDLINFESAGQFSAGFNSILGGEGNDTIVAGYGDNMSASDGMTLEGGAGADLFTTTAALTSAGTARGMGGGQFRYSNLSDSTFGASDTIQVGTGNSGTYVLNMPGSVDVFNGQLGSTNLYFTGGILEYSATTITGNPLSLGQMVTILDANLTNGQAVGFRLQTADVGTGQEGYVFVKGATDDLLVTWADVATGNFSAGQTTLTKTAPDAISLSLT